jgi:hypothetical protein
MSRKRKQKPHLSREGYNRSFFTSHPHFPKIETNWSNVKKKVWRESSMSTLCACQVKELTPQQSKPLCKICGGIMTDSTCCRECKKVVHLVCTTCDNKIWYDVHEWCYCQLELLTTPLVYYWKGKKI